MSGKCFGIAPLPCALTPTDPGEHEVLNEPEVPKDPLPVEDATEGPVESKLGGGDFISTPITDEQEGKSDA